MLLDIVTGEQSSDDPPDQHDGRFELPESGDLWLGQLAVVTARVVSSDEERDDVVVQQV